MINKDLNYKNVSEGENNDSTQNLILDKKNSFLSLNERDYTYSNANQRLIIAIKLAGYKSLGKFAAKCGFTTSYLSKIINHRYTPTIETAEVIANTLGLGLKDVFEISELRIPELDFLLKKEARNEDL